MNVIPFFFGIVSILIGWSMREKWKECARKAEEAKSWPTCTGRVKESQAIPGSESENGRYAFSYVYERNGDLHESRQVDAFGVPRFRSVPEYVYLAKKYPEGSLVTVYLNPDSPTESLLEPGDSASGRRTLLFGFVFLLTGFILLLAAYFGG